MNCAAARAGKILPQTQSSVAISGNGQSWFLINASPDVARQIEAAPGLQPRPQSSRNSPIAGIFLTNADIDHALGLVLLRNHTGKLIVHATDQTRTALEWMDNVLARFSGIEWRILGDDSSLGGGLSLRVVPLKHSVAFEIRDNAGAKVVVAPAVGGPTDELRAAVDSSEVALFDGTFWSDNELQKFQPSARTAREMNHWPIKDGSLDFLSKSSARRKIYIHINNTNPILMPGSPEQALLRAAGIEIAHDGMEIVP